MRVIGKIPIPPLTFKLKILSNRAFVSATRVVQPENSLVWHQQVLGWINRYSGIAESNPDAVKLSDTIVPVVDIDAGPNN